MRQASGPALMQGEVPTLGPTAMGTGSYDFDDRNGGFETCLPGDTREQFPHSGGGRFADGPAGIAHEKCDDCAAVMIVSAGEIGIAALDAMDKTTFHQKVQCAIDRNGRRAPLVSCEHVHDLVRSERFVAGGHCLKDETAQRREPFPSLGASRLSISDRIRTASGVVVVGGWKNRRHDDSFRDAG
jgi:hypothetical protein